jgi:hypothetical protein
MIPWAAGPSRCHNIHQAVSISTSRYGVALDRREAGRAADPSDTG